jgi:hypothetical protein
MKRFTFELPIYIKDSHEIYRWDLVNVKNFLSSGTLELFMTTGTLYFWKNAYMWDPTEFYDDLEHFILK